MRAERLRDLLGLWGLVGCGQSRSGSRIFFSWLLRRLRLRFVGWFLGVTQALLVD